MAVAIAISQRFKGRNSSNLNIIKITRVTSLNTLPLHIEFGRIALTAVVLNFHVHAKTVKPGRGLGAKRGRVTYLCSLDVLN